MSSHVFTSAAISLAVVFGGPPFPEAFDQMVAPAASQWNTFTLSFFCRLSNGFGRGLPVPQATFTSELGPCTRKLRKLFGLYQDAKASIAFQVVSNEDLEPFFTASPGQSFMILMNTAFRRTTLTA